MDDTPSFLDELRYDDVHGGVGELVKLVDVCREG